MQKASNDEPLDLDEVAVYSLKIFGDVFESLIGAIFIDSESLEVTKQILFKLIMPYVETYSNLETIQDHPRTNLLELWNQKPYMKDLKCEHQMKQAVDCDQQTLSKA